MKKIKLLAPILTTVGTIGVMTPILTSCNKESNVNKVVLQEGQKLERTVTGGSGTLAFYFKQENAKNPEDTKVYLKDFSINSVSGLSAPDKTIKFNADSAGNMRVTIDVRSIYQNWNYVETISCTLVFRNKTAGTEYEVGPIVITIPEEGSAEEAQAAEDTEPDIEVPEEIVDVNGIAYNPGFDNDTGLFSFNISEAAWEEAFFPETITIYDEDGNELTEGYDYIYFITNEGKTANVWLANSYDSIEVDFIPAPTKVTTRNTLPFIHGGGTWSNNVLTISDVNQSFGWDLPEGVTWNNISFNTYFLGKGNDGDIYEEAENQISDFDEAMALFEEAVVELYENENIDQTTSYLLVKYDLQGTDADGNDVKYYGSCAINVEKDAAGGTPVVVEPDIHND